MDQPFYPFTVLDDAHRFDFISVGKNSILKAIVFKYLDNPRFVSLALADVLPNGHLDVLTRSNNGDMEAVLATVFQAIRLFLDRNSELVVCFWGSSDARTRLYQIAIARERERLERNYNIWGMMENGIEPFKSGRCYLGFFISLKNVNIV